MKVMRRNFLAIVSATFLSIFEQGAVAATGPTIKCIKVGQKTLFRGYTYSCIKSRGKLVWKQGAKVATTSPTASATASASALTFVAKTSEVSEGQTKIVVVKPATGASFSVAVTRASGSAIVLSATCTHLGCIVGVGKNELKCPCHGSAFNATSGAVNNGPAEIALRKYISSESSGSIYIKESR